MVTIGTIAPTADGAVLGEMYKNAGKWYNLTVQVAAGRIIKYTAELRHRHGSRYLSAGGVFVWSSGLNEMENSNRV